MHDAYIRIRLHDLGLLRKLCLNPNGLKAYGVFDRLWMGCTEVLICFMLNFLPFMYCQGVGYSGLW